ncbi:MAG TPA: universal stress protein [Anaeromyxobacteraceae bacterium]|nr:universal stress protein [Anaeromyxobacteraceae bacterium]
MVRWLEILCAVDFSKGSSATLEAAADVARRHEANLTLLHVREPPPAAAPSGFAPPTVPSEVEAVEIGRQLERWREEAARLAGREVRAELAAGAPASEIVRRLREGRFDLAVVGTHGRTGLRRLVLGSVAERVVREAPCPVLVVRPPEDRGD